jgi:hypothetical protein
MPSVARSVGEGLLMGLRLKEAERNRQRDELMDEMRREQLEDLRFQRKTLLSQLKQGEEEAKRQEMIADIAAIEAGGLRSGEQFMRSILAGEQTPLETKQRLASIMDYVPGLSSEEQFRRMGDKSGLSTIRHVTSEPFWWPGATEEERGAYRRMESGLEPRPRQLSGSLQKFLLTHQRDPDTGKWVEMIRETPSIGELLRSLQTFQSLFLPEKPETPEEEAAVRTFKQLLDALQEFEPIPRAEPGAGLEDLTLPAPPETEVEKEEMTPREIYNRCRAAGGSIEECKRKYEGIE